jgi:hypothetical protein
MKRARRLALGALLGSALASISSLAAAQPTKAELDRADKLYVEGRAALEAGRVDEACAKLEQSLAIDRAVGTLLNLARCHEVQGRPASAWREYTEASILADKTGQADRASGARDLAGKLAPKLARLKLEIARKVPGLIVERNGTVIPEGELDAAAPVDPGTYAITVRAPGYEPFTTSVQVGLEPGLKIVTVPELKATPAPPPDKPPGGRAALPPAPADEQGGWSPGTFFIAGAVTGGVGLVGVAVGAAFGVMTIDELDAAENDAALCPNKRCSPAGRDAVSEAETKGVISTVALAVGGAAVATGVILIVLDVTGAPSASAEVGSVPRPVGGPGDGGVSLVWSF